MTDHLHGDEIRTLFSSAMSDMYRTEVPQYGTLIDLVARVNDDVLRADPALRARMQDADELDRLTVERHGAIRLGTAGELSAIRRMFAVMGMFPVGYYDLSVAGLPVHSTAFRPIDPAALSRNPFRVFTSLVRLELLPDRDLADAAAQILSRRQIVTDGAMRMIRKAETALYHAKRSGRGLVVVYTQDMEEAAKRVTRIEQALRRAVSAGDVEPHFQPIVDLASRRIIGFEALARWTDGDLGSVSPGVFIPIAEERGIIGQLSQLLLRKATLAARQWPESVFLSFNLSPSQLVDQNTCNQILTILSRSGLDPRRLEIEITETGVMSDPASAEKIMQELRSYGIRIALDDFGTGQSSLGRLREFHFDKIKIDQAFVASILTDRASEHIVRAILAMCEGLNMDVVAEGIEDEAQATRLLEFGCPSGQGYYFGRPVDAETALFGLGNRIGQRQAIV